MKVPSSLLPAFLGLIALTAHAVPTNVALNQPVQASSEFSPVYPAENAVDGNSTADASRWLSSSGSPPHWLEVDLEQTYQLSQVKFWTGHYTGNFPLDDWALQYWNGSGWTDLYSITGSTDDDGAVDVFFGPTVSGNRVRLNITALDPLNGDDIVRLFELEIYGEPHGLTTTTLFPERNGTLFDPAADIEVTFDAAISSVDLSGIRIEDLDTQSDVPGVSGSVSGNTLTISHGGLATSGSYAVHIPGARVALAADAGIQNGALYWEFATAPLKPQLVSYTDELPGLTGDLAFVFDRDITLVNPADVSVEQFSTAGAVGGISVSAVGSTLSIAHDPLLSEEGYVVTIPAGTFEANINGELNEALSLIVYADSTVLIDTDFDTGLEGFNTAHLLGETTGTSSNIYWKWTNSGIGPDFDSEYLRSDTNYSDDFVVSPLVNLTAGRSYTLTFRAQLARALHVGLTPTASLADVEEVALVGSGGPKTVSLEFTATSSGPQYLIFFSGETNPWQEQAIDTFLLVEAVPPLVRINTPADGSAYLESDAIPVEVEAYGIAADIASVEIFDNGVSQGTLPGSNGLYPYTWDYHAPGEHVLRVEVTDVLGNMSSDETAVTINFDNGTLPDYIGWDFDDGPQSWEFTTGVSWYIDRVRAAAAGQLSFSSPEVFLYAGQTYTVQFKARTWGTANTFTWGFLVTANTGFPADDTGRSNFNITSGTYQVFEIPFTVPADGPYRLTFFETNSSYNKVEFDDIRLIGNFNSVPLVTLTNPASSLTTIAGATVTLKADAQDADGSITQVEFRDLGTGDLVDPAATVVSAPWEFDWITSTPGTYEVFARATDDGNGIGESEAETVVVARNLYSISTYLGAAATDEAFTGAVYLSDGTLVMSGIIDPALFPGGLAPAYLNGATVGDRGVVVRLSEDGQTVLSVTVVGTRALDIDTDGSDRIFVAAGDDGVVVLDSTASSVLWSNDYGTPHVHRIDAADGGTFAVITSSTFDYLDAKVSTGTNYAYSSTYTQLGSMGGVGAFTTDVAVDEASQTIIFIGWKNIVGMQDGSISGNPVDIPGMVGRAYDGTLKWRAYDWEKQESGDRWLNLIDNNMADTRGSRVIVSPDGKLYAGIEFDGGNTPLRYDPFDITLPVTVVGGDQYHSMSNTSTVPKTFVGRYDPGTGAYETGQWITARLANGNDNTIRIESGNLFVDSAGRIHVVGGSASGLPLTHDPLSGINYTGGAYHLVYSPDFTSREYLTRLTLTSSNALGNYTAIAVSPSGAVATAGQTSSPYLFDVNAWQSSLDTYADAHFAVGVLNDYYKFQSGSHPRLFFDEAELADIQARLSEEPYASMYANLVAKRDYGDFYRLYDPSSPRALFSRAQGSAFIYALSGEEAYAQDARDDIQTALALIDLDWAEPGTKGLDLYSYATELAMAYDLCATSEAWDAAFNYQMSKRLLDIAEVIVTDGGTEQPSSLGSNWRAARGASAGLAYLATDHSFGSALASSADVMVQNYLNTNQAPGAVGWNPEGFGYTAYAIGNYVGPYGVAADKANGNTAYRDNERLEGFTWSGFTGATTAYSVYGLGGVKTDWSDDNAHTGGEGTYGLAFYYADADLKRGIRHAYDRFMGTLSPFGPDWDGVQQGSFWSILFYDSTVNSQDPTEIWGWHARSAEFGGTGTFTFRNAYADDHDILAQFKAKLDDIGQAHDGPDGLGFRLIGLDDAFVVGGGRDSPGVELNQATVYPANPDVDFAWKKKTGSLVGTPLIKPDGGGHVVAQMTENNVGTFNHKRWFVADYDTASTGADLTLVIADTSTNGLYWQLPTFLQNTITQSGNTFTITGTEGATLKGTILHPGGSPSITIGTKARGSSYTLENGGTLATEDPVTNPRIEDNRYLHIQGTGDGSFLVVLTLVDAGGSHPSVTHVSGSVADAIIQVGNKNYALQATGVLYSTGADTPVAYVAPNATVTFDADGKGTLGGAPVQSVPYGGSAVAPVVSPDSGYTFMGWDKSFAQVVKSMTVTALYDAIASGFGSWIGDPLYGLALADQDPGDNPDFDPYDNLMEYALVLNPSLPDGAGVVSVREESGNLILSYRVRDGASDITVTPKHATSLSGTWSDIPGANITPTGSGPNYTEYEASMPIGSGPLFLILEVSQN